MNKTAPGTIQETERELTAIRSNAAGQAGRNPAPLRPVPGRWADLAVLLVPALFKLVLHLVTIKGYGLHGDELYYLACSDHLDWGYVDHPPLSVAILKIFRLILGDSYFSIRLLSALAGGATVLLTGLLARRMGAGRYGQLLASVCAIVAPLYLGIGHAFTVNALDLVFWVAAFHLMTSILSGGPARNWVWLGVIGGLGIQNKLSMLFLGFGLVAGLVLSKQRRLLLSRGPWLGGLVAGILVLPQIAWQIANGWPTLEFMHNAQTQKNVALPLLEFIKQQILQVNPLTFPLWAAGLFFLLFHARARCYRALGWCYLVLLALFATQGGKPYYLGPVYSLLFAAGAVALELAVVRSWLRASLLILLVASGAPLAPFALPILPVDGFIRYSRALGVKPSSSERFEEADLPSFYANMFGWDQLAEVVHSVYQSLPPDDQKRCAIYGQNYMQAGAIDYYGGRLGLPRALAGHNSYWLWGFGNQSIEVAIIIGGRREDHLKAFDEVEQKAVFKNPYIQPIHNNQPIFVARKPKMSLKDIWPRVRFYI